MEAQESGIEHHWTIEHALKITVVYSRKFTWCLGFGDDCVGIPHQSSRAHGVSWERIPSDKFQQTYDQSLTPKNVGTYVFNGYSKPPYGLVWKIVCCQFDSLL